MRANLSQMNTPLEPFDAKADMSSDAILLKLLGKTKPQWDAIVDHIDQLKGIVREWKFYGRKYGWQLKVADKKRAVVYLIPRPGGFTAALALNERAVEAVRDSDLPAALVHEIENAKVFPEGRAVRIDVTGRKQADMVKRLVAIKLAAT